MKSTKPKKSKFIDDKKGFMRTLEAFIAVFLSFVFLVFFLPSHTGVRTFGGEEEILSVFENDADFRNCVLDSDTDCIETYVDDYVPVAYDYVVDITSIGGTNVALPDKKVYIDTLFISSNSTDYEPKTVKLYYWEK